MTAGTRAPAGSGGPAPGEVLIEVVRLGACAKVVAIDPASGIEVSITGPANAPRKSLEAAAVAKLRYVLKKPKRS